LIFLVIPLITSFVSLSVGFVIIRITLKFKLLDIPGERSSHTRPTPTMGGLAIVTAFLLGMILLQFLPVHWVKPQWLWWFIAGGGLVAAHGLIDDVRTLPPLLRFILFCIVAGLPIIGGIRLKAFEIPFWGMIELGMLEIPLTMLWILAIIIFYNFMDGIDGLAVGVGAIVAGFLAYIAWEEGNTDVLILSLLLGGSCLGFVRHNFPPAKIFMGDVGSTFIGYTLAMLALIGKQTGQSEHIPLLVWILLLGAFLFDTIVTLGRRIMKKKKWYLSHREHYYQRMIDLGFSHIQITLGEYGLTFLLGISAILYSRAIQTNQTLAFAILFVWLVIFISLIRLITSLEKKSVIRDNKK
jgi:UDP-GlcNAc:undecaprenyl-phosphate GlcNAc-1-phosphate transferase